MAEPSRLHVPFREPFGHPGRQLFAPCGFIGQPFQVTRGHRLGHHHPAERVGPGGQQAILQGGRDLHAVGLRLPGGHEKPVTDSADSPPAGQPGHGRRERAPAEGTSARTTGEGQHDVSGAGASRQRRSRGQDLDRAARLKAHPAKGHGSAGVVGGDQGSDPLCPAGVTA